MKFTLLNHAALWLEHGGTAVLVDPWLQGDCYDGAWAPLLDPGDAVDRLPRPDAVLYTHAHPDHCHLPTLRTLATRFGSDLPIVIPRFLSADLAAALSARGFRRVREAAPGLAFQLGGDLSVSVYPLRADDAVQVFRAGEQTLVNANDCQLDGRVLAALVRRFPAVDFYLGQYSIGDGYPLRIEGIRAPDAEAAAAAPAARFRRQARAFNARHAVPTASGFRFAHEDNRAMNRWITTLDRLPHAGDFPELTVLHPGDGWNEGPERDRAHRLGYERAVSDLRTGAAPCALRATAPPAEDLEAAALERFTHMFSVIPAPVRRRMRRLGFHLDDLDRGLTVDWAAASLSWRNGAPPAPHYRLAAEHFHRVCRSPRGWSTLHIASCFTLQGCEESDAIQLFLPVSTVYALGYFGRGLRSYLSRRTLEALWARRAELADVVPHLWKPRSGRGFWRL